MLALPPAVVALLLRVPRLDPAWNQNTFHFYTVSGTALLAAGACAVLVASARSLRETRLLFLALAFLSIAAIFAVHGLTTPGFIHDEPYPALSVSSWLSLFVGALFITASAAELPERAGHWVQRWGKVILLVTVAGLTVYALASLFLAESEWLSWVPIDRRPFQVGIAALVIGLLVFSVWRYLQAYFFARLPSHWAAIVALALLIDVQVGLGWGRVGHLSWWLYHALYALAFVTLFAGWGLEALRAGSLKVIAEALSMRDALAQLNRGRPSSLIELADAIEAKDVATLGHVGRVAMYALGIGRELGLPPWELRSLVLAAQMHDVGKIGTPDAILCKPGPLSEEEFAIVKQHAARGDEITRRVEALRPLSAVIRHHHERLDGTGYPDGLRGEAIPVFSRIIAVADTFDALTSSRPYRTAADEGAALGELRRVSGSQLDPRCVEAFIAGLHRAKDLPQEPPRAA
ncbi:MAG: hypothetical protein A2148_01720 [Chloroflexi bacterium RBG_16_68_14]|nr:MAG: hypothetical protein A2148_01720 [Chloroflexi bacterium RBG_16_68_14]